MQTEIKKTADGSSTLFVPELDEHYHSVNGAVQESDHVFIRSGLDAISAKEIAILEVGFGTGLNALLSFLKSDPLKKIEYHSLEKYPLDWEKVERMDYDKFLNLSEDKSEIFKLMHTAKWNCKERINDNFLLKKEHISLQEYTFSQKFDLIYFDAFAPEVQPEMWVEDILRKIYSGMNDEGVLVTYCAKGEVRRRMERSGFSVERLQGPPGKREMLRASKKKR